MESDRIIMHIDVNSAFLSWSAIKALREGSSVDLREIPSIVGGDQETRHGIVVAKSIPAKKYGIHTADTVASAYAKCPFLVSVPPDHAFYREQSKELMRYLFSMNPVLEQVSIDECYLDYSGMKARFDSPEEAAVFIKDSVYEKFGFTVNVGISDRKVLAKMASDFEKPNLVHTLYRNEIKKKLWPLPIEKLHMCGKSSSNKLKNMGVFTIRDLACTDKKLVESWLKTHGTLLWNSANGLDDSVVNTEPMKAKGVGNSTTLSQDVTERKDACGILKKLCKSVSMRLQKKGFLASQISVEIKYASFENVSHQMTMQRPVNTENELYANAIVLFDELWNHEPIRLLGVRTTKLTEQEEPYQMDLFSYQIQKKQQEKNKKMEDAISEIRLKYGKDAIKKGSLKEDISDI